MVTKSGLRPGTAESMAKANATRLANIAARAKLDLISESFFERAHYWDRAARAVGITQLPDWSEPMTVPRMNVWMRRLGLTANDVKVYIGENKNKLTDTLIWRPANFIKRNPRWPLRVFVATLIENAMLTYTDAAGNFTVDRKAP